MSAGALYVATSSLPVSATDAFAYHERQGALQRLIPPWESVKIERSDGSLAVGSEVVVKTSLAGIPLRWLARHTRYDPPHLFADEQVSGPFASWDHTHEFLETAADDDADGDHCILRDSVAYRLPLGFLGRFFGGGMARRTIESMFAYRHRLTRDDLSLLRQHPFGQPLRVAISGSTGMVGTALTSMLRLLGHTVVPLVRGETSSTNAADDEAAIAPWSDDVDLDELARCDAVVHLAGKPIAEGRWSTADKKEIESSRVEKTTHLCKLLARLENGPKTLICASASGFYGDRGDEVLDEESPPGEGFLPEVCQRWEQSCSPAIQSGIRVVNARLGLVLTPQGGALAKMLLPAKFCGGRLGSGKQWWSWIGLDDCIGALYHAIMNESISGPMNVVSPQPVTNLQFVQALGRVIGRPAIVPAPAFMIRTALGEMADALLLASARVRPTVLAASGYPFRFSTLESQLSYCLGRDIRESDE